MEVPTGAGGVWAGVLECSARQAGRRKSAMPRYHQVPPSQFLARDFFGTIST